MSVLATHDHERGSIYTNHTNEIGNEKESPPAQIHEVELERNFSMFSLLGLAFTMFNSWNAANVSVANLRAAALPVVLSSGGTVSMIWGILVSFGGTFTLAITFAELCHVFPLTGGQYDWSYIVAPPRYRNVLSFYVGWMGAAGWISLAASASAFAAGYVKGFILLFHPDMDVKQWVSFLLYLFFTGTSTFVNAFGVRALPGLDRLGGLWGGFGLGIICITILACSSGKYQPPKKVFADFINETGWPDGIAFILGLLQSMFSLTGFEGVSHMIEEMPRPSVTAPKVMLMGVSLGAASAWVFMVILMFCLRDLDAVITSPLGPVLEIYHQATGSAAGATCLCFINMMSSVLAGQGVTTIASRMVLSFARDRGLGHMSGVLSRVHPYFKAPVWCVAFVGFWIVVFGCISLGSTVALNAILSSAVVFLQFSYIIPLLCVIVRDEKIYAPYKEHQVYSLGRARRPLALVGLAFLLVTTVCFAFPPAIPITASTMNYVVVVWGVLVFMATVTWFVDGRKNFHGPTAVEARLEVSWLE